MTQDRRSCSWVHRYSHHSHPQVLWDTFTSAIQNIMKDQIPSNWSSSRYTKSWANEYATIKHISRRQKKALKKYHPVCPLRNSEGVLQSDAATEATLLNNQFASVFTDEDTTDIPKLTHAPFPGMDTIENGVAKMLRNIKPHRYQRAWWRKLLTSWPRY